MSYGEKMRKHSADKIFLFGLLVVSLLLAYLVVRAKRVILLGEAVGIPAVGISVRLPSGNGWQSDKTWRHDEDTLVLRSVLRAEPSGQSAQVVCIYRLAGARDSGRAWLEEQAADFPAELCEYGTRRIQQTDLEWVHIKEAGHMSSALAAAAALAHGRWLDIEITQVAGEDEIVQQVFDKVTQNITIEDNGLLEDGLRIISQIKAEGLDKVTAGLDESYYYLVKDSSRRPVGFLVEMLVRPAGTDKAQIQAASFGYITEPYRWETAMMFKSNVGLDEMVWETETEQNRLVQIRRGPLTLQGQRQAVKSASVVSVEDSNKMTVQRLGPDQVEFETRIPEAAIPDAVITAAYVQMLKSNTDRIIVDAIISDGRIKPAVISVTRKPADAPQADCVIETEYIGDGQTEQTYLDSRMHVIKKVLKLNGIYVLEPVDMEELTRRFPERADYILQRSQAMRNGRL